MNFIILCIFFIIATTSQVSFADDDDNSSFPFRRIYRRKCPSNSHWTKCYLGAECANSCEKYLSNRLAPECLVQCDSNSQGGCECNRGYILNHLGQCVLPNRCRLFYKKQVCQSNERRLTSKRKFCNELTCQHYWNMEATFSKRVPCHMGSCTCNIGYVRNEHGKCIEVNDCAEAILYKTVTLKSYDNYYDADGDAKKDEDSEDVSGSVDSNGTADSNDSDKSHGKDTNEDKSLDDFDYQDE